MSQNILDEVLGSHVEDDVETVDMQDNDWEKRSKFGLAKDMDKDKTTESKVNYVKEAQDGAHDRKDCAHRAMRSGYDATKKLKMLKKRKSAKWLRMCNARGKEANENWNNYYSQL